MTQKKALIPLYLSKYAEASSLQLSKTLLARLEASSPWNQVVIVPACGEKHLERAIQSIQAASRFSHCSTLILVSVNNPPNPSSAYFELNQQELSRRKLDGAPYKLCQSADLTSVLWIDQSSRGREVSPKLGVGYIRKFLSDLATDLHQNGMICGHYIHSTDADASVPLDYFSQPDHPLLLYPYQHLAENEQSSQERKALSLYDTHLRYLSAGYDWAKSPYAYHSIGSTIRTSFDLYAAVRGFPKRPAGEDFHFLNKARKVAPYTLGTGQAILLSGRLSHRVPFGTGQSVASISQSLDSQKPYTSYSPVTFRLLKSFLLCIKQELNRDELQSEHDLATQWLTTYLATPCFSPKSLNDLTTDSLLSPTHAQILDFLIQKHIVTNLTRIHSQFAKSTRDKQRAFDQWFDALRSLQLIHFFSKELATSKP